MKPDRRKAFKYRGITIIPIDTTPAECHVLGGVIRMRHRWWKTTLGQGDILAGTKRDMRQIINTHKLTSSWQWMKVRVEL